MSSSKQSKGAWYVGAVSYTLWGFFPIYWKVLAGISALQLICHRIVWSFLLLAVMVARSQELPRLWHAMRSPRIVRHLHHRRARHRDQLADLRVGGQHQPDRADQPRLFHQSASQRAVFGMVVFHERLRRLQWISVALAAAGVVYLTVALAAVPWIALSLAATFGTYGLMKKLAPLGPVHGLTFETGILFLPSALYLIVEELAGRGAFMHAGPLRNVLDAGVRDLSRRCRCCYLPRASGASRCRWSACCSTSIPRCRSRSA